MKRFKKNLLKSKSYSEYFELSLVTEPSDLDSETDNEKLRRDAVESWKNSQKKGCSCVMVTVSKVRSALFRMIELGICIGSG